MALDMEFAFKRPCVQADRITQGEVQQAHAAVDHKGFEGRVGDHGAGLGQFDEADDGGRD